jgi:glycosyltransferase involved in cell wall biosynthesis
VNSSGVTVLVCCHNASARLPETLRHLAAQRVRPGLAWEILVVDNASTDGTAETAESLWQKLGAAAPLRIVREPQLGNMAGRMTGIRDAKHEYVLFCDDDNWLSADYVQIAAEILDSHPEVGAAGGCGEPAYETAPPEWVARVFSGYAVGPQAGQSGLMTDGALYGAGMIFRQSAVMEALARGARFYLTGRRGKSLSAGDDTEFVCVMRTEGWVLWYDDRLRFRHFIPSRRLTWAFVKARSMGFGASSAVLDAYELTLHPRPAAWFVKSRWYLNLAVVLGQVLALAVRTGRALGREQEGDPAALRLTWYVGKLRALASLRGECDAVYCALRARRGARERRGG